MQNCIKLKKKLTFVLFVLYINILSKHLIKSFKTVNIRNIIKIVIYLIKSINTKTKIN